MLDTITAGRLQLELERLTDDQLAYLAAHPMDAGRWELIEDELRRRIDAGETTEWTIER